MSENSSFNTSLQPTPSLVSSAPPWLMECVFSYPSLILTIGCDITSITLLLPLCILIIQYGVSDWQRKRFSSSAAEMSHINCFTYHMVTMELIGVIGLVAMPFGILTKNQNILDVGFFFGNLVWHGEIFFNMLTCVERYLAVIHPITYLSLRNRRGIQIRDTSIGFVWLLSFVGMVVGVAHSVMTVVDFCVIIFFLAVTCFCSLSVLWALARPGPGERCAGKDRMDRMKLRAFYTIVAVLGLLVLRFISGLVWSLVYLDEENGCLIRSVSFWLNLPCSLLLPLLFLQRNRKVFVPKRASVKQKAQTH